MSGFTDIHHHLIYGIDDGPKTFQEMVNMIVAARKDGIERIIATPHVYPGIRRFDEEAYKSRLREANSWCRQNDVPVKIRPGAEVLYTPQLGQMLWDNRVPKMNDTDYVLIEFMPGERPDVIENALRAIVRNSAVPIIAHVERLRALIWHTRKLLEFKKSYEAKFQVNCSSVLDKRDFLTSKTINRLFMEEQIDFVATDAHNTTTRRVRMTQAYNVLCEKYARDYADALVGLDG